MSKKAKKTNVGGGRKKKPAKLPAASPARVRRRRPIHVAVIDARPIEERRRSLVRPTGPSGTVPMPPMDRDFVGGVGNVERPPLWFLFLVGLLAVGFIGSILVLVYLAARGILRAIGVL